MTPTKTVEEICQAIERYQLMSAKSIADMRTRWFRPDRKEVADTEQFRKWLVLNQYVTEFVAKVVSGRKSDQLVLDQYRLIDQLISGPMAGAYLAIDPLERRVAIEVLSATSAADKAVLIRFQQAALKAMSVQHPNVGRILDSGEAHGLHFLVKEYYEGQTLEDILERRRKLPYQQATRIMALALAGVDALHQQGVPAGDLTADCLLLAAGGKESPNQKTIKILHAGVRRKLFDETAIGRSIAMASVIPDELELAASSTFQVVDAGAVNPAEDIFQLGTLFYRCVTGLSPSRPARPVNEVAPEVPEMLGQIIDEMIDATPANRPQKAANVAKSLRVFLAADEQARDAKAEDNIELPTARTPAKVVEQEPEEEDEVEEEVDEAEEPSRQPVRKGAWAEQDSPMGKLVALWGEVQPEVRDLVFLASGALGMLFLIFLVELISGMRLTYVAGLVSGAVISLCVEWFLRWRRERTAEAS